MSKFPPSAGSVVDKSAPFQIRLNVLQLAEQIVREESLHGEQPANAYSSSRVISTAESLYSFVNTSKTNT